MIERNKVGLILFLLSESVFFALLILAYAYYHWTGDVGATAARALDVVRSAFFSLALLGSSGTLWLAELARGGGNRRDTRLWLVATLALGLIFLTGQGFEYANLLRRDITISRDLFGTTFFTLTSFHGLHVAVGLILLGILAWMAFFGARHEPAEPALGCVSLYWHFVDAVWVVIFSVVYLWGYV